MMMTDALTQIVRRALADMIGLYFEDGLTDASKQTIIEFYKALKEKGEDVTEYEQDYATVVDDVRQLMAPK